MLAESRDRITRLAHPVIDGMKQGCTMLCRHAKRRAETRLKHDTEFL